ncbi:uncharacterized protein BJ171DRAFT_122415 [Polychytrium aggregatum]|uniref:uncharacterized protein n=1 Tax=Polychytrium aggregatum TaxID=110093 RepID=UPI0022FEF8F4|nr:uncharacterized protein BJ171DRAFT_122415 [Polychytrium aggregatum]KAI9204289.1 hypothetical protein BJ171DRAFT_122415 [Polychytrium aggregatum]
MQRRGRRCTRRPGWAAADGAYSRARAMSCGCFCHRTASGTTPRPRLPLDTHFLRQRHWEAPCCRCCWSQAKPARPLGPWIQGGVVPAMLVADSKTPSRRYPLRLILASTTTDPVCPHCLLSSSLLRIPHSQWHSLNFVPVPGSCSFAIPLSHSVSLASFSPPLPRPCIVRAVVDMPALHQPVPDSTSEQTPLLRTRSAREDVDDPTRASNRSVVLKLVAILLPVVLVVSLSLVYFVYIPVKMEEAANRPNSTVLHELSILSLNPNKSVSIFINTTALFPDDDLPLVLVSMQSSREYFMKLGKEPHSGWADSDGYSAQAGKWNQDYTFNTTLLASVVVPTVVTPPGAHNVTAAFVSVVEQLNLDYYADLLHKLMKHEPLENFTFRTLSIPSMVIPWLGSWKIPVTQDIAVSPDEPLDTSVFNVTTDSYSYGTDPSNPLKYVANANLSFTNPYPVTLKAQSLSYHFSIYYEEVEILRGALPSSTHVDQGRNHGFGVEFESVVSGTGKLMEVFGRFAEGEDTDLVVGNLHLGYHYGRKKLGWVEKLIGDLRFDFVLPGAQDEGDDLKTLPVATTWAKVVRALLTRS